MGSKINSQIFCDMDGVLVDYMGSVVPTINKVIEKVVKDPEYYKEKHSSLYKSVKKAVAALGGDIEVGDVGRKVTEEDLDKTTGLRKVRSLMYTIISNDYDWWYNLDWAPGGRKLWDYIKRYNPIILTAPQGPNSKEAKKDWIARELGISKDRVIVTHSKHDIARRFLEHGVMPVLIDDLPKYVVPFRHIGGIAILHKNTEQTIAELKVLGF